MHMGSTGTITSGQIIPWDTIDFDPNNNLTTGIGAKYTCPVDGFYLVITSLQQSSSLTMYLDIAKNGVAVADSIYLVTAVASTQVLASDVVKCLAGDVLTVLGYPAVTYGNLTNCDYMAISFLKAA
jgi:hypothetical protein